MTTISEAVEAALAFADEESVPGESAGFPVEGDLYLQVFSQRQPVLCIQHRAGGDLTRRDVDAVREALAAHGRPERESWLGMQGVNWLSIRVDQKGGDNRE